MSLVDFIIHIDNHLLELLNNYHNWIYIILFLIIFCETGLVITPLLPGDSLIFAGASLAAIGGMNIFLLAIVIILAAIIGDLVNFSVGKYFGDRLFSNPDSKIFKQKYLEQTKLFYHNHGGKTIIIARFIPIIRTFAPFVAGMGHMHYLNFFIYNALGAVLWVSLFSVLGYYFGNIQIVKENLSLVLIAIIIISVLPIGIAAIKARYAKTNEHNSSTS